jgi:hypothetical protein
MLRSWQLLAKVPVGVGVKERVRLLLLLSGAPGQLVSDRAITESRVTFRSVERDWGVAWVILGPKRLGLNTDAIAIVRTKATVVAVVVVIDIARAEVFSFSLVVMMTFALCSFWC